MEIQELNIILYPNIPNEKDKIELRLDMLYHPDITIDRTMNKYPFFISNKKYPADVLGKLNYQGVIETFFIKSKFNDLVENMNSVGPEMINDTVNHNIMTMLRLIFPTKFPIPNNIQSSHDILFNRTISINILSDLYGNGFSYMQLSGKKYTVKRMVWLNDVWNDPVYAKLITKYILLKKSMNVRNLDTKVFTTPLSKKNAYYNNTYPEYVDFVKYVVDNEYLISTNSNLTNMMDNTTKTVNGNVNEFFNMLGEFAKFYNNEPNEIAKFDTYLNVGVNIKNTEKAEIHVLCDFIGGELNGTSLQNIQCLYNGDELGNELDKLVTKVDNVRPWKINKNRSFVSIDTLMNANKSTNDRKTGDGFEPDRNNVYKFPKENKGNTKEVDSVNKAEQSFLKLFDASLNSMLSNMNGVRKENIFTRIDRDNKPLYIIINRVFDETYANEELYDKLNVLISEFSTHIKNNQRKLSDPSTLSDKIKMMEADNLKYTLYVAILDKLVAIQSNKKERGRGGSIKKRKTRSNKRSNKLRSKRRTVKK